MDNTHAKIETLLLRHRVPIHARAEVFSPPNVLRKKYHPKRPVVKCPTARTGGTAVSYGEIPAPRLGFDPKSAIS
jgi:hypothetical protein